jgi:lysine-ketoglutarate reductase/saccharopine dehydrogenase-like protein (TIGR00300 family)
MADSSFSDIIELRGHIIDSMILPSIMDEVMDRGGDFVVQHIDVGRRKNDTSYARIEISAPSKELLDLLVDRAQRLGATAVSSHAVRCEPAPSDGVFPEGFYSTTNLDTEVLVDGRWLPVQYPEMDCAIVVNFSEGSACTTPHSDVRKGDQVVVGHEGVRVLPLERPRHQPQVFAFMGSSVSSEKPKSLLIKEIAERLTHIRGRRGRTLVVAGPALVHTGMRDRLVSLIDGGFVQALFAGNGLATHDIECALYGSSLGVSQREGVPLEAGHEHHLRAINRIRQSGGIRQAVEQGVLTNGIMHACVRQGVDYVLGGSVRDDGPLPDVISDVIQAQQEMRRTVREGVDLAIILSSMLHGIATGNLLPARVTTVCVDISPAVVTKLTDRGSFQTIGLVMDVEGFLRELTADLGLALSPSP